MERFTISKSEKQTIYEIYRACRLCGAGGGYRMPIIQNIVDLETSEVELRQKIQDCLQLEVRQDDRMPPLICELCVDKVNDFYKFLELSRQTNIRTRTRLGLPLQTTRKGEPDAGDCILGVTEPLIAEQPAPKKSTAGPKCSKKVKSEAETVTIKVETNVPSPSTSRSSSVSSRSSRAGRRPPTPPRPTRGQPRPEPAKETQVSQEKKKVKEKEVKLKEVKEKEVKAKEVKDPKGLVSRKELYNLLQDNEKYDDNSLLVPRSLKRREEPPKPAIVPKRTRASPKEPVKEPVREPTPPSRPGPKSKKAPPSPRPEPRTIPVPLRIPKSKSKTPVTPPKATPPKVEVPPQPDKVSFECIVCEVQAKTPSGLNSHLRTHAPTYTKPQNACNPCGKWFVTAEEAATHHRYHRAATFPYHCRRCFDDYRQLQDYNDHIDAGKCVPYEEVPDVKCEKCWRTFITYPMMEVHKCQGIHGRPGGNCPNCSRTYATVKTFKAHQRHCTPKKNRDLIADPDVLRRLKPMQVRISRCDDLLAGPADGRYDVSTVKLNHGLDKNYLYPYIKLKVKPKPLRYASTARRPIKDKVERDSYTHWDSEDSDSDSVIKRVDSLMTLCLKKLFSKDMLGKVPRKRKTVRTDVFDSVNDFSMSSDINDIISSLNNDLNLRNDCARRNRKDSLIAIAINDIIGVPNSFMPSDVDVGNENVARNETNDVHRNDRNEDSVLKVRNENDKLKTGLSVMEIENEGADTVNSVSDISTELNLIETEDQENTRNEAASENVDSDVTNDFKKQNDNLDTKNNDESEDSEIRNFKSVDGENNDDNLRQNNDLAIQNDQLGTEGNSESTELKGSEMRNDNLDSENNYDSLDVNNHLETQNESNDDETPNTKSEMENTEISNDNLDMENNYNNLDINNHLETQNESNDGETPNNKLVMENCEISNDNLDIENNYDNLIINDSATQKEKYEHEKSNDESDLRKDNLEANHSDNEANGNKMDINEPGTQNASNDVILSSETDIQNSNFNLHTSDNETSNEKAEINPELNRIDNPEISEEPEKLNLQNSVEKQNHFAMEPVEIQNSNINGVHDDSLTNQDSTENVKSEEINNVTKESPIKHSIDNLIGDTVRNPDKYIDEVISSIEDIIKNNEDSKAKDNMINGERNAAQMDDQNLMDAIDAQIGEDKDKITLDDLLPKEDNRSMELDDISDDDFNFDA